jgi:acyl carrier protein
MTDTLSDVRRIAGDIFKLDAASLPPTASRDTVPAWDSVAHVNLVLAVEQHFDIQFMPEEMLEMLSIELVAMLVDEKLSAK